MKNSLLKFKKNIKQIISVFLLSICASTFVASRTYAQNKKYQDKNHWLHFEAKKNNLKILPTRFEYSLWDENRLSVGNILVDTTQMNFKITPSKKNDKFDFSFSWPAGILTEGTLVLKNNSGEGIFFANINDRNINISKGIPFKESDKFNSDIASLFQTDLDDSILARMKNIPFMIFCVYRETEGTHLYLCSKELYLSHQNGQLEIKDRKPELQNSQTQKSLSQNIMTQTTQIRSAQVQINGEPVGDQGFVYLTEPSQFLNFKARTQSGAFLEMETRKNEIDFNDIVDNAEKIIITAKGAEPTEGALFKKTSDQEWQINLEKEHPVLYIKGDGGIPLRQEFSIEGPLPKIENRITVNTESVLKTYSSEKSIQINLPTRAKLGTRIKNENSEFAQIGDLKYQWTLKNIRPGPQRHYLYYTMGQQNLVANIDTLKGRAFSATFGFNQQTTSLNTALCANLDWWFENFLFSDAEWSQFHWGASFQTEQFLKNDLDIENLNTYSLDLLWRAQSGFHFENETWGLSLPLQYISDESTSGLSYGIGGFLQTHPKQDFFKAFAEFTELKLKYYFGSLNEDLKLKSAYTFEALAYSKNRLLTNWQIKYGIKMDQYNFSDSKKKQDLRVGVTAGLNLNF